MPIPLFSFDEGLTGDETAFYGRDSQRRVMTLPVNLNVVMHPFVL